MKYGSVCSGIEAAPLTPLSLYCQSLNELRARQAHMLKEVGDQWCTPDALWWGINARFGPFVLDLFADHHNARCEAYYTAEDNALTQNWSARLAELGGAAYANPPYSRAQQFEGSTSPAWFISCDTLWRCVSLAVVTYISSKRPQVKVGGLKTPIILPSSGDELVLIFRTGSNLLTKNKNHLARSLPELLRCLIKTGMVRR